MAFTIKEIVNQFDSNFKFKSKIMEELEFDVIITAKQIVTSVRRFGPAEREAVRETLADAHQFVSERVQQLPMTTWMTPVGGGGDVCC